VLGTVVFRIFSILVCCVKNLSAKIQETAVCPGALFLYKSWSVTLREERGLWMYEYRVVGVNRTESEEARIQGGGSK